MSSSSSSSTENRLFLKIEEASERYPLDTKNEPRQMYVRLIWRLPGEAGYTLIG
jgi:hypothetical protein